MANTGTGTLTEISHAHLEADKVCWLLKRGCDVARYVPPHMRAAICDYIIFGLPMGHFLNALLSNDLMESFGRADEINALNMRAWTMFLYNEAPRECWGSPELVAAWCKRGGLARLES